MDASKILKSTHLVYVILCVVLRDLSLAEQVTEFTLLYVHCNLVK